MGRKRVKLDSESHPNKCAKRYEGDDDRISGLVDDIIVVILSFLPLKEAARTSVLSSRWVNLWKYTSCLNFDAESTLQRIADAEGEGYKIASRMEIHNYRKWVNHVLKSHKAPTLREFRICFDWRVWCRQKTIIKWLKFALARQVQRLELDLKHNNYVLLNVAEELLTSIGFKSLTSLTLKYVNVSGEAIEFFLRNCPLLEKLAVNGTNKILNLEVCGSSLALKHLDLCSSMYLKTIKISAPNLLSLKITILDGLGLQLDYVPMLVEVSVDNNACRYYYLGHLLPALTCCISRLEILDLSLFPHEQNNVELYNFPEMLKLKKLCIRYRNKGYESLLGFTSLIRASPYLEEFVFKLSWGTLVTIERSNREVKNGKKNRHQHLKVFEFHGYYGRTSDVELVLHIVENCAVLEKIIIDPSDREGRQPRQDKYVTAEQTAKKYAKQQLEGQLPQHIEFAII